MDAMVSAINKVLTRGAVAILHNLLNEGELIIKWRAKIQNQANACIIV